jgi:hypothetical protein
VFETEGCITMKKGYTRIFGISKSSQKYPGILEFCKIFSAFKGCINRILRRFWHFERELRLLVFFNMSELILTFQNRESSPMSHNEPYSETGGIFTMQVYLGAWTGFQCDAHV